MLRFHGLKLSQRAFAERYGLGYPTIRDLEQGQTQPKRAMRLIVAAIARDPDGMAEAARMAALPCICDPKDGHCCTCDP